MSLYASQGRKSQVRSILAEAASYRRNHSGAPATISISKAAGIALLESAKTEDLSAAAEVFRLLHQDDPADRISIAGFVAANSAVAPERVAKEQLDSLSPVATLIADVDAAALEEAGIGRPTSAVSLVTTAKGKKRTSSEQGGRKSERKPKKIRKSRMAKDHDPSKVMDPERWLPLRDRSTYKPKGKRGKAKMAGLTQGGIVSAGDEKSLTGTLSEKLSGSAGGGAGSSKKKGKKGKGAKW